MLGQFPLFPGDPILTEAQARQHIDPIAPGLCSCVTGAFEIMKSDAAASPTKATALDYMGTRPMLMNALVVARVHEEFGGVPDVEIREPNGFAELRVDGVIDLRFKHVDRVGRSRNMDTPAQKCYRNLLPQDGIGKLDVMRLTVGWRWDAAATRLEDILVVFLKGADPIWKFSIRDVVDGGQAIRLPKDGDKTPPTRYISTTRRKKRTKKGG